MTYMFLTKSSSDERSKATVLPEGNGILIFKSELDYISRCILDRKDIETGGQLFGNWIKWFLLTAITCGIYGFWVAPRLYNWVAKHTHFV